MSTAEQWAEIGVDETSANYLSSQGVTVDEAEAWLDAGFSTDEVENWATDSYWISVDPWKARVWLDHGFDPYDAAAWETKGFCAGEASEWRAAGLDCESVSLAEMQDFTIDEVAPWLDMRRSVKTPWRQEDVNEWIADAAVWRLFGIDPDAARQWLTAGFSAGESVIWSAQRFTPHEAAGWRESGFTSLMAAKLRGCRFATAHSG